MDCLQGYTPSPFWGGVAAMIFYNTVIINPASFLSLLLGITIGSVTVLALISFLMVRGYLFVCTEVVREVVNNVSSSSFVGPLISTLLSTVMRGGPSFTPSAPRCCRPAPPFREKVVTPAEDDDRTQQNSDTEETPVDEPQEDVPSESSETETFEMVGGDLRQVAIKPTAVVTSDEESD